MSFVNYVPSGISLFNTPTAWHSWWKEDSILRHNWLLESYLYGEGKTVPFREELKIRNDVKIMIDSGGFSIATGRVSYLDPLKVMKWEEENGDIGFILDYPPISLRNYDANSDSGMRLVDKIEAQPLLKKTAENAVKMAKAKTNDKFKLLYICHGFHWDYMQSGLDHLTNSGGSLDDFQGLSISRKGSNPYTLLEQLFFIKEHIKEDSNFHVLGVSGFRTTPLIHYILRDFKNVEITYDSTSYLKGSKRREYMNPLNIKHFSIVNEKGISHTICDCEICKKFEDKDLNLEDKMDVNRMLCLHNLKMFLNYNNSLNKLTKHPDSYKDFAEAFNSECKQLLEVCDFAEINGFQKAKQKFNHLFTIQEEKKQRNVMEFF